MAAGQQGAGSAVDASAHDPFRGFKFQVLIGGAGGQAIGFQSVAGISEETEVVEYREGSDPITMRKLPGLTSYDNLTLERGLSKSTFLLDWRREVAHAQTNGGLGDGVVAPRFRRTVTIRLVDKGENLDKPVKSWEVFEAWPSRLEISDLDAGSSDVVIETLELAHEGWVMKPSAGGGGTS